MEHAVHSLTGAQYGMWLSQQMSPDVSYAVAQYVDFEGALDVEKMRAATRAASDEFVSPYVRIDVDDSGAPVQRIDRSIDAGAEVIDIGLADLPEEERVAAAVEWMRAEYARPLDLAADALIVNRLIEVSEDRWFWYARAHHAVIDGYGASTLQRRVAELYTALVTGEDAPALKPKPLAPEGFVAAEEKYFQSARAEGDAQYWSGIVPTLPEAAGLGRRISGPSPLNLRHNGESSHEMGARLDAGAERLGTNRSGLVIAAFGAYVAAIAGRDELSIAVPVAARTTAVLRGSTGMTANVLPVPVRVGKGATVSDVVDGTGLDLRNGLRHQLYPAARMEAPTLREGVVGSTFGDTINIMMFSTAITLGETEGKLNLLTSGPAEDVAATVYESEQGAVRIDMEANPATYTAQELAAHHARFMEYLDRFAAAAGQTPLSELDVATDAERADWMRLAGAVDGAPAAAGPSVPMPELLRRAAAAEPARVAVVDGDRSITYAELDQYSDRLARHLISIGARPEERVALRIPRSLESVIAVWAVTKTGAAFVPIDPKLPAERAEHISEAAAPVATLTPADLARVWGPGAHADTGGSDWPDIALDTPAYVIFTSGSTGRPKGVSVTHSGLSSLAAELVRSHGLPDGARVMHFVSPGFDASVLELLMAVDSRSTLVVVPPDVYGGDELTEVLAREKVNGGFITPAAVATLDPADLPELTSLGVGGDTVPQALVDAWAPGRTLVNVYGPTETTIAVTLGELAAGEPVRLGGPIPGTRLYVLDSSLRPTATGVAGELYISGPGIARGYHGNPVLTAERFVANPFEGDGVRMYRTGDVVRWTESGTLEFLGRIDSQVKLRGFRIELGEIDAAVMRVGGTERAITVVHGDDTATAELVSYVTGTAPAATITAAISDELPAYMVPAHIIVLDEFPLTVNGKVDYKRLPQPERNIAAVTAGRVPKTDAEKLVAEAFAEVIPGVDKDKLNVTTTLFDLGGNSLSATRIAARIGSATGNRVSVATVFAHPTVEGLAAAIGGAPAPAPEPEDIIHADPTTEDRAEEAADLLPAQHQMWVRNRVSPDGSYHIPVALHLRGDVDVSAMRAALGDVVARHTPLRTVYRNGPTAGEPEVQVLPAGPNLVPFTEREVTEADLTAASVKYAGEPFDLAADVPIRARLYKVDAKHQVLVLVIHHIAADGWSMMPLAGDLASAYAVRTQGKTPRFAPLPRTYTEHARSYKRRLTGAPRETLDAFWAQTLAGLPAESVPPAAVPRSGGVVSGARSIGTRVAPEVWAGVAGLARAHVTTPFIVVHAALAAAITRLSGQEDLVIGTAVAGRGEAELDGLVGMFVNSIPLRTRTPQNATFSQHLGEVSRGDLAALDHSDLPFESVLELVDPPRAAGRHPIFQVMLNQRPFDAQHFPMAGIDVEVAPVDVPIARFDLEVTLAGDGTIELRYASELYRAEQAESILDALVSVLHAVGRDPELTIAELPVMSESRLAELTPVRGVEADFRTPLGQLMREAARTFSDRPAVIDGDRTLTYRELYSQARTVAAAVVAAGSRPGEAVLTDLPRSADSVIAFWGIALAGAAVAPVDPKYPKERRDYIADDIRARVGVTASGGAPGLSWVAMDRLDEHGPGYDPQIVPGLDDAAYVIYTSGSTGQPKGTVVTHRGLENFAEELHVRLQTGTGTRVMAFASTAFDATVLEHLLALRVGAPLVIVPPAITGGRELERIIADNGVTHGFLTPSTLATLAPEAVPEWTHVLSGGEAINPGLAAKWSAGRRLHNGYGPTETTIMTAISDALSGDGRVPIGPPVRGQGLLVLDELLRPVPVGMPGELYVAGPQLARGYHRRPELTASRFVANPYGAPGSRMYRTGDVVRWSRSESGELVVEFVGRNDFQVKIRGIRIELGEIDSTIGTMPGVDFVTTQVLPGPDGESALVAYVKGGNIDPAAVRAYVRTRLPAFMVPAAVMMIDAVPMGSTGKLDKSALPEPRFGGTGDAAATPTTPGESRVVAAFRKVLSNEHIGVEDDFFDLGGNSLSANELVGLLGNGIEVRTVFDLRTPSAIAAALTGDPDSIIQLSALEDQGLRRVQRGDRMPLSSAQERMWLQNKIDPGPTYNIGAAFFAARPVDKRILDEALRDVLARHESLRTRYPSGVEGPYQEILAADDPVVRSFSAEQGTAASTVSNQRDAIAEFVARPFVLNRDLPIRLLTAPTGIGSILSIAVHHIAADGASVVPLTRDLMAAYLARTAGTAPQWEELPLQYADYAVWQRGQADKDAGAVDYFAERLRGIPEESSFPADGPRPTVGSTDAGEVAVVLPSAQRDALAEFAGRRGVSVFMVLHAALVALLHRVNGSDDVVVGTPVIGRTDRRLRDVVGMFVNTVALRTAVKSEEPFSALVDRIRGGDLDDLVHATAPFERVIEAVAPPRSRDRHPLFQVVLSHQNLGDPLSVISTDGAGMFDLEPLDLAAATTTFDATFEVREVEEGLRLNLRYRTDLYTHGTAEGIVKRLARLMTEGIASPGTPVADLPVLLPEEEEAFLRASSSVEPHTMADILARAVRQRPGDPALRDGVVRYTYSELDSAVTALANRLAGLGVGSGTRVAVSIPRSAASVVAFWAVARIGAVYVPIDPSYPAERIRYILDDAKPSMGLTVREVVGELPKEIDWVLVDPGASRVQRPPVEVDPVHVDDPAYVIYTSGSTGRPKGVVVPHRGLAAMADTLVRQHAVGNGARVLHFASPSFDASILELLLATWSRAELVIAPTTLYGGSDLGDFLAENEVTHAFITPAALATIPDRDLPLLEALSVGGDVLQSELARRWSDGRILINAYGPTEVTIAATMGPVDAENVSIGSAVTDAQLMICDERLNLVPPGAVGELYVAGPGVAHGYLDRPELTASRFVANPYSDAEGYKRMYRTGDLVRWRASDSGEPVLEFVGRSDDQLKVRGFRVEPGEVATAVESHPSVRQAVVVVDRGDGSLHAQAAARLVAYYVADGVLPAEQVRAHITDRLPRHMIPSVLVQIDRVPVTAHGKTDLKALPPVVSEPVKVVESEVDTPVEPAGPVQFVAPTVPQVVEPPRAPRVTAPARPAVPTAPRGITAPVRQDSADTSLPAASAHMESAVAEVLSDVLGVPSLGLDDDFFTVGGTSLQAAIAVDRLRERFGAEEASIRWFFEDATVRALAARIAGNPGAAPTTAVITGVAADSDTAITDPILPLRAGTPGIDPLYCVHPAVGLAWNYLGLSAELDPSIPIIGLQAPGISHPMPPADSIKELARNYVRSIRATRPHGPYNLLGWSLGGLIAHEMAVELRGLGEKVNLALMDAYPLSEYRGPREEMTIASLLREFVGLDIDDGTEISTDEALDLLAGAGGPARELSRGQMERLYSNYRHNVSLGYSHVPREYDGNILVFRATHQPTGGLIPQLWRPYVTGLVQVHDIEATHNQLGSAPAIDEVARTMNVFLTGNYTPAAKANAASFDDLEPLVSVRGLARTYGRGKNVVHALDGVDLDIAPGSVHALLGPNGAGKTTTVKIIATLLEPTAGSVTIDGVDALADPRKARSIIGLSGQYSAVDENLTGRENLEMFARLYGFDKASAKARANELLSQFRLTQAADRRSGTYSGGMRRRLDLAGAIIARPRLVVLDEPTTGLDPRSRKDVWDVIARLSKEDGIAVLLTTQYLDEAELLADLVTIIDQGKIIRSGTVPELKAAAAADLIQIGLRERDRATAWPILARHAIDGTAVREASGLCAIRVADGQQKIVAVLGDLRDVGVIADSAMVREATLDDVFFALTGEDATQTIEEKN
ncbi:Amino acid adenylation domain protein OS=Tsukamurella paurometabola (strain ATCC 8368 / DSM/ CCUG 35730 / CIP 100753 / JCM 10117 / KCTC 9821 / NBRC 16120/ NCIMB 702349 / NCTC 13040) OX=521096 GN=Tpau_3987 PE=4 SV=1 [Tsukamurella paurometabola]|uniref:Amino acid adenylation domain protein n=1 Tax=Tsukamurella paurometabola (strain ATCC 8368 / DSM 20162 / CCUG 35730 / CIP 100753 / JCM 10117 / KCTC 9821 / NBRC 16120 / NCIMB 702349 / NCTC 13040) TaxID=521096 RepID=D5UN63_TSUPD|nr:non-ribosomal peptide synthetase [Tsukamurella paurometabola]ADG80558.1 amino acid adenylation domain protein [Tsukamurella paurometabola DSM 20162]SUP40087.1 Tyrocidine synthase III [Tsukamurella paurometabola]